MTPEMQRRFDHVKENDFDVCPECGNRKGNTITIYPKDVDDECGEAGCAKCGLGWVLDVPEDIDGLKDELRHFKSIAYSKDF